MKRKVLGTDKQLNNHFNFTFWGYFFSAGFFAFQSSRYNECLV